MFVDCTGSGDIDLCDLAAKCGPRTRAVLPVYLWGRGGDPAALTAFARKRGLRVVEDACQAHATLAGGRPLGTFGDLGCFSLKDGKILWSGEGGYILTSDDELAATCRAYCSHWMTPPPGQAPLARLGNNYRLAEPLAAIARANLARFGDLARQRHAQATRMLTAVAPAPGLTEVVPHAGEAWNGSRRCGVSACLTRAGSAGAWPTAAFRTASAASAWSAATSGPCSPRSARLRAGPPRTWSIPLSVSC